jgi:hypothetical protein
VRQKRSDNGAKCLETRINGVYLSVVVSCLRVSVDLRSSRVSQDRLQAEFCANQNRVYIRSVIFLYYIYTRQSS